MTKTIEGEYVRVRTEDYYGKPIDGDPFDYFDTTHIDPAEATPADWVRPALMSGSDYGGSGALSLSNYRVFKAEYGERDGIEWRENGTHGSYMIAIRLDAIDAEIAELFERLENYPVIDDEDMAELENDWAMEAWEIYARADTIRAIAGLLGVDRDELEIDPEIFDPIALDVSFCGSGIEWISEYAGSYIDVDVLARMILDQLREAFPQA